MNQTQIYEFLRELDIFLRQPVLEGLGNVIILTISNFVFHKAVRTTYRYTEDGIYLPVFAFFFGLFNTLVCGTWFMMKFVLTTALVFATVFQCCLVMKQWFDHFKLYHVTKVICVVLGAVRFLDDGADFPTYLCIYVMMSFKLMSAADDAQHRRYDDINKLGNGKVPACAEVVGYLLYTGYAPYKDFLSLRNKQHQWSERWWKMIGSSASRAIMYRVFSYQMLSYERLGNIYLKSYVLFLIRAFQFRCQYYYWLQLRELEPIAAGIKRGGWVKHTAFDFNAAEKSIRVIDFLIAFNLPISSSLRNSIAGETVAEQEHIGFHALVLVLVIMTYNLHYGVFLGLFISGIYSQTTAVDHFGVRTCLVGCPGVGCRHTWTRRQKSYHLMRFVLIILNQMRLALLFCNLPGWKWRTAMIYGTCAIGGDGVLLSLIMCAGLEAPLPLPPRRRAGPPGRRR